MVNLSRRFKLEYEDATDGTTVIAETGQDTGAPKIDRHVHIQRTNDTDILKLWLEEPDFGNTIPTDRSNFATAQNGENEPEILYKQYDQDANAFVTQGRFYAKNAGSINEEGELAVKLYSFMRYTAKQDVNMSDNNDVESAMQKVLPNGYTVVNAGSNINIDGSYSINSTREKGYQELTRNYNFALTFTAELDANNNYKVKYEPVGQGGTVDTLVDRSQGGRFPIIDVDTTNDIFVVKGDRTQELVINQAIEVDGSTGNDGTYTVTNLTYDSNDNETDITVNENIDNSTADGSILPGGTTKFKSWEKDKTDSIVNKVTVEGVNTQTSKKIIQTANNDATQDKVGIKSRPPIKIGYLNGTNTQADNEAKKIAKKYLVPGKKDDGTNISELPESGRVKTTVYTDNVVNDSFQVVSNKLNIDDTYTCRQQRNFWPEGATELDFEFEQEGLEQAARDKENLRDERARLHSGTSTDVGNQDAGTLENDDTTADVSASEDDESPSVEGDTDLSNQGSGYNFNVFGPASFTSPRFVSTPVPTLTNDVERYFVTVNVMLQNSNSNNSSDDSFDLLIRNDDTNTTLLDVDNLNIGFPDETLIDRTFMVAETSIGAQGDSIEARIENYDGGGLIDISCDAVEVHSHGSTNMNAASHNHNVTASDAGHGGPTSGLEHIISGSTAQELIDLLQEVKSDR